MNLNFINFKVSLLMEEAKNDPVKKAGLIRDIVVSISKIPDRIQQEVYVQECSRIMDISESVLFNELAQLNSKAQREVSNKTSQNKQQYNRPDPNEPPLDVLYPEAAQFQKTPQLEKVNELKKYEREIIKILLLYGNTEVVFEDYIEGEMVDGNDGKKLKKELFNNVVSKEIYLNLQDDEVEFTDTIFKQVYYEIKSSGYEKRLIAGIVVTGGGSQLKHITQLFEYVTGMSTRIGFPTEHLASGTEEVTSPMFATGVGLILKGYEHLNRIKRHEPTPYEIEMEEKRLEKEKEQEQEQKERRLADY